MTVVQGILLAISIAVFIYLGVLRSTWARRSKPPR